MLVVGVIMQLAGVMRGVARTRRAEQVLFVSGGVERRQRLVD